MNRTGLALLILMLGGLTFEFWPNSTDTKPEYYSYVILSHADSLYAIDSYKRSIYFKDIDFFKNRFLVMGVPLSKKQHWYFIYEHIFIIGIVFLWANDCRVKDKKYIDLFLILMLVDMVDYLISYNSTYIRVPPVSCFTISFCIYTTYLFSKWQNTQQT